MLYPCGSCGSFDGYRSLFFYPCRRSLLVFREWRTQGVGWVFGSIPPACVVWGEGSYKYVIPSFVWDNRRIENCLLAVTDLEDPLVVSEPVFSGNGGNEGCGLPS